MPDKDGWPTQGDKMRFLNKNGRDYQRTAAAGLFKADQVYEVVDCEVGDWDHDVEFVGIPGRHNGVMFEFVTD